MNQTGETPPLTILLADDDMDDRHLFAEALKVIHQFFTVSNSTKLSGNGYSL